MKYSPDIWGSELSTHDIWFLLGFYIDYLYSTFLIFRINAVNQARESLALRLSAARDLLSTILVFNEQRERLREVRSDFTGVVCTNQIPLLDRLLVGKLATN